MGGEMPFLRLETWWKKRSASLLFLQPWLHTPRAKEAHLTAIRHRGLDNSIEQVPHDRNNVMQDI